MTYKLADVCDVRDGTHDSPKYVLEGYPLVTSKNIVEGRLDLSIVNYLSKDDYDKINERSKVDSGDIIMPMIGTIGNPYLVGEYCDFAIKNVALIKFPNANISNKFVWYFLKSSVFKRYVLEKHKGGTQKFLSLGDIRNMEIPQMSIDKQLEIVENMEKISNVLELRQQQIHTFDDLIKARFVELFKECNNYELLGDADILISDGNYSSKYPTADEFVEEGVPFIRASNMVDNTITDDEMYHISAEKHAELLKGHVKPYDVLIATRGAGIGKVAVVPERHNDSNVNAQIVLLRCNKEKYNPLYLSWYLKLQDTQIKIQGLISGSAQPQLPIKRLVQLELLRPDIEKQNDFADFVHQVDKSKVEVQKALDETQTLFDSLMQQYFG